MRTPVDTFPSRRRGAAALVGVMLLQTVLPCAALVSQLPGIYVTPPDSNVMFTLDDSLSMLSDVIPDLKSNEPGLPTDAASDALDGLGAFGSTFPGMWGRHVGGSGVATDSTYWSAAYYAKSNPVARYLRSSAGNPLYYNPAITYTPWPDPADDTRTLANANPKAVVIHPSNPLDTAGASATRNLTKLVGSGTDGDETRTFWPATYYVYRGTSTLPTGPANAPDNFDQVIVRGTGTQTYARADSRTDCTGPVGPAGCSRKEELQNFANWLQYYRSRMLMAKGGVAGAFAAQGGGCAWASARSTRAAR